MNDIERLSQQLNSDWLRTFLMVADLGNVTHAADALHKTQSAVSVQIKHLESVTNTPLFTRQARGMMLTPAGEVMRKCARDVVQLLDKTAAVFVDEPIQGPVKVGIPDDYGHELLANILADFAIRHPKLEVSMHGGFSVNFPAAIQRGELDLAIYTANQNEEFDSLLTTEKMVWVSKKGGKVHLQNTVPLALFDHECWWHSSALTTLGASGRQYRVAYSSNSAAGVEAAVQAGLAVGVIMRSAVRPGMQILTKKQGFNELPKSRLFLLGESADSTPAIASMADVIRAGFKKKR
ncbi:MAG: LysR family transcriptional regulator [Pseudomonadota bacterium]